MNKKFTIFLIAFSIFCTTACSGLNKVTGGNKNEVHDWIIIENQKQADAERKSAEQQAERKMQSDLERKQFDLTHPELPIEKMALNKKSPVENSLAKSLNEMNFVTRYPGTKDGAKVYVKVGDYQLSAMRFQQAISEYAEECRRVSAYSGENYKNECITIMSRDISAFAKMIKSDNIPNKTKSAALSEASYGRHIDFGHAARLAKMHTELCSQQGYQGYVVMETVAAPCRDYKGAGM